MYELLVIFHCVAHLQVRQFYEVVCYTLCATLGFNKRIVFPLHATIWAVTNLYHLGA